MGSGLFSVASGRVKGGWRGRGVTVDRWDMWSMLVLLLAMELCSSNMGWESGGRRC